MNNITFYFNTEGLVTCDNGKTWIDIYDFLDDNKNNSNIWCANLQVYGWLLIKVLKDMNFTEEKVRTGKQFRTPSLAYKENCFCIKIKNHDIEEIHISEPYCIGIFDCSGWFKEKPLVNENHLEEEWNFINQIEHNKDNVSPITELVKVINSKTRNIDNSDPLNLRPLLKDTEDHTCGGFIEGIPGFYKKLYHYDYTSYYPSILYNLKYLSNLAEAEGPMIVDKYDFDNYMYVSSGGCITFYPLGGEVYKVPLNIPNPFRSYIEILYNRKAKASKDSTEHFISKLHLNSLIGLFTMTRNSNLYTDLEGKCIADNKKTRKDWSEWFCYITAKGRNNFGKIFKVIEDLGGEVVQVNTDGLFTTVPIDFMCDKEKGLGSLRSEYEAHNVYVFAGNQYACDEEVCIAGLPKKLYKPNQRYYEWITAKFDKQGNYTPFISSLTLGRQYLGRQEIGE